MSLLFESITNLIDPWEIPTQEWVLSSHRDHIPISFPCLPYKQLVVTSSMGPIIALPWIHPFRLWWSVTSWKSVFTTSLCRELFSNVFSHEILSNFNNTQKSCFPYKIYLFCESLNCFLVCSKVNRQFSCPLFWAYTMELLHGKLDSHFQRIPTASFSQCDPKFLVDYSLPLKTTSSLNLDQ